MVQDCNEHSSSCLDSKQGTLHPLKLDNSNAVACCMPYVLPPASSTCCHKLHPPSRSMESLALDKHHPPCTYPEAQSSNYPRNHKLRRMEMQLDSTKYHHHICDPPMTLHDILCSVHSLPLLCSCLHILVRELLRLLVLLDWVVEFQFQHKWLHLPSCNIDWVGPSASSRVGRLTDARDRLGMPCHGHGHCHT